MSTRHTFIAPDIWVRQIFSAKAARDGGIVRRSLRDIDRMIGRDAFERELQRRGYSAVFNAGQVVIFCNNEPVRLLVGPAPPAQKFSENFCQDFSEKSWSDGKGSLRIPPDQNPSGYRDA
ncbi:MAG: aspartate aminotransferase [Rhodobacterales bacterium]|uniref:aspartate aminotransferase n=1 Tax=Puniceibacterium antarcticum TaxID=1206336 RepID=UPI003183FA54